MPEPPPQPRAQCDQFGVDVRAGKAYGLHAELIELPEPACWGRSQPEHRPWVHSFSRAPRTGHWRSPRARCRRSPRAQCRACHGILRYTFPSRRYRCAADRALEQLGASTTGTRSSSCHSPAAGDRTARGIARRRFARQHANSCRARLQLLTHHPEPLANTYVIAGRAVGAKQDAQALPWRARRQRDLGPLSVRATAGPLPNTRRKGATPESSCDVLYGQAKEQASRARGISANTPRKAQLQLVAPGRAWFGLGGHQLADRAVVAGRWAGGWGMTGAGATAMRGGKKARGDGNIDPPRRTGHRQPQGSDQGGQHPQTRAERAARCGACPSWTSRVGLRVRPPRVQGFDFSRRLADSAA